MPAGPGSEDLPERKTSTSLAACLPSVMPHTTKLWPRRQSPAANTPGTLVAYLSFPVRTCNEFVLIEAGSSEFERQVWKRASGVLDYNSPCHALVQPPAAPTPPSEDLGSPWPAKPAGDEFVGSLIVARIDHLTMVCLLGSRHFCHLPSPVLTLYRMVMLREF